MDLDYISKRITQLRLDKNISERKLSLDLGHNSGYFYNISSRKSLPSLKELLAICDYFEMSPKEFFSGEDELSLKKQQAKILIETVDDEDLDTIMDIIKKIKK